jgi:hypothetical protein
LSRRLPHPRQRHREQLGNLAGGKEAIGHAPSSNLDNSSRVETCA